MDLIDDPTAPMRRDLTPESVAGLVRSIQQMGILQPLLVKPVGERYEVIAGHRRLRASRLAGLVKVPVVVAEFKGDLADIAKIHENIYRQDVNPVDESIYLDYMIKTYRLSPQKLAEQLGKSPNYVHDRLQILSYPDNLKQALADDRIKISVARIFARIDDPKHLDFCLKYALTSGITPRVAEQWYNDWKRQQKGEFAEPEAVVVSTGTEFLPTTMVNCLICAADLPMMEARIAYVHELCLTNFRTMVAEPPIAEEHTTDLR